MNLRIYISEHCWGCDEARKLAVQTGQAFPELRVEVIDIDQPGAEKPEQVFATPTYLLNGQVVSLGNPKPEALCEWIEAELRRDS